MTTAVLLAAGDTCMRVSDEEIMSVLCHFSFIVTTAIHIHTLEQITDSLFGMGSATPINYLIVHQVEQNQRLFALCKSFGFIVNVLTVHIRPYPSLGALNTSLFTIVNI